MATLAEPPRGKNYYSISKTLFEIDAKYVPIRPLGRGTYGVVCSSVNIMTDEKVAIKKIKNVFDDNNRAIRIFREIKISSSIKHDNIIALKDVMMPDDRKSFEDMYLVYELMDTDLRRIIRSPQPLTNAHCKNFLSQLLRGLKYLHSANILHRDLKPGNLFINSDGKLKIGDFGLARTGKENGGFMTAYVVTRSYRAPELLLGNKNYGTSIDVWSVGCIFAELLGRKPIFRGRDSLNQLKVIHSVLGTQSEADLGFIELPNAKGFIKSLPYERGLGLSSLYPQADRVALDLLERMLMFDPSKRITVTEALHHPYLCDSYDPEDILDAEYPLNLDVDENASEPLIRKMMLNEILHYHPEATYSKEDAIYTPSTVTPLDGALLSTRAWQMKQFRAF